ncbi:hypothetical protein NECAME_10700 [Necator americanus]|uniref:Tryptophan synthase beta chain-like PALP domain-containing protein n=1 Tax=Necator americanus TaxID=51031 RepID=W2T9N9_NECAM|nr:hypothetical protein NECAME_10700 [Necator americanus]ETN77916.1 hypothetical protein NECAME_10700 [Necator americanus]
MASRDSIAEDTTELIGNTPMVYLRKIGRGLPGTIAAKVEYMNPACSVKDRIGLAMIKTAEETRQVFLYRLSAKPCELGRDFLVPCGSCWSTLAYQLKSFKRQASLGGFRTLSLLRAVVKLFNEPVMFLVDVVHCGIFAKAG